jgi:Uma2 family endonuclease
MFREMRSVARRTGHMTLLEWAALDDVPGELVDGILVEEEMTTNAHEAVTTWLTVCIDPWAERNDTFVFGSMHKIAVGPKRGRKPDVTVYPPGAALDREARLNDVTPLVVIEVVTSTPRDARRDRVEKRIEYARAGIRYYWIVDPTLRTLEIFELGKDGRYVSAAAASDGVLRVPGMRGLRLDVSAMFARLDRLR